MKLASNLKLNFGKKNEMFYSLLKEEDFDFKTKEILVKIEKLDEEIFVNLECSSVLDLKIATNALIKSLEIIEKTLNIENGE